MAGTKEKKTCYYELLGVDRKCDAAEIKSTYRKLALKMHPDKAHQNGVSVEEATKSFQQIQEAYSVLSDPQERAWYDAHREQILKGHDDGEAAEDPFKTRINLYKYFSSSCFNGFGDGSDGFFSVYGDLFAAIDAEEAEWEDLDSDEDHVAMPPFGRSDTDPADVASFYRNWLDFCSRKAFHHADKWNPKEAPNRQVRRAMEMENKKARQAAKKDFNAEVRQLVKFVQKRDPRVKAQQKQQMKESVEKKQREQTEKEQRKAEEAVARKERQESARLAEEARWAEYKAQREERRARGEVVSEDEDSESEKEQVEFVCEACRKSFKSEKAYDQHAKSKKHLQVVAALRRELERELQEEADTAEAEAAASAAMEEGGEPSSSDRENDTNGAAGGSSSHVGQAKDGSKVEEKEDDGSASEDEEDEEGDFLARFAARRSAGGFAPPSRAAGGRGGAAQGGCGGGSSSSSSSAAAEEEAAEEEEEEREQAASGSPGAGSRRRPAAAAAASEEARRRPAATSEAAAAAAEEGAGRRAQKRAQQRAVLLERQRERDGVEDLVNGCRKAQRAAKRGEANEAATDATAEAATNGDDGHATAGSAPTVAGSAESARCAVCGETFLSRTKLFQHIKASGHAALKPVAPQDAPGKTKNKKR